MHYKEQTFKDLNLFVSLNQLKFDAPILIKDVLTLTTPNRTFKVTLNIIGASHYFEIKDQHTSKVLFSELMACCPLINKETAHQSLSLNKNELEHTLNFKDFYTNHIEVRKNTYSCNNHFLISDPTSQSVSITYSFPNEEQSQSIVSPRTVIQGEYSSQTNLLTVKSIHEYHSEKTITLTTSTLDMSLL